MSMFPTVPEGSLIIVNKQGFGHYSALGVTLAQRPTTATIKRGDVLVHQLPDDHSTVYVKRVVGLPGDTVVLMDNRLTINGNLVTSTVKRVEGAMNYSTETFDGQVVTVAWDQ